MRKKVIVLFCLAIIFIASFTAIANAGVTYHTKATLIDMFKNLCDSNPSRASYSIIGKSYENRDIYIFKIGNPNGGAVMWDGSMHGWEDIGSEVEYLFANWLLTSNTAEANRILQRNYILFIPIVNMDSTERENRDFSKDSYGVDLNRNFVSGWNYIAPANTGYPNSFHGTSAGSEPETKAMRNAFQTYHPKIYVNCHYGGGPYLQKSGPNTALSNWIDSRIKAISLAKGFTFPWSIQSGGLGGGFAITEAASFGANVWLWEIASNSGAPYKTGPGTNAYMHKTQTMADVQNWYFPKMLPALMAMCEAVEVTTPTPTPTPKPTATPTPTITPTPTKSYLTVLLTGGKGWTTPLPGTYTYTSGSTTTIRAYNNPGWQFAYWSIDGTNAGTNNPLTITMNANHTIQAKYTAIP